MKTLAFFHGMDDEAIRDMLPTTARAWTHEEMDGLRREAKRQQRALDIEDTAFYNHQKLLYRDSSFLEKKIGNLPEKVSESGTSMVLASKSLPRVTWKTRLQKAMATAPDDQHRAKAEEKERQRWIRELMTLLEDAGFLGNVVREEDAMKHLAARVAAGRRASTLRQHVRYGRRLQSYMETVFGLAWLRGHGDFIGYVALLLEEPCGRTVPSSLFKSLAFLEMAAEVSPEKRVSNSQALHNYLLEIEKGKIGRHVSGRRRPGCRWRLRGLGRLGSWTSPFSPSSASSAGLSSSNFGEHSARMTARECLQLPWRSTP